MANPSKYCYDNGVLINKFDIYDLEQLHKVERGITIYKISELKYIKEEYLNGSLLNDSLERKFVIDLFHNFFNVDYYLMIHYILFKDIYSFAGEVRDEAIYKSNEPYFHSKTPFCYPSLIYTNLDYYLKEMRDNVYKINSREKLLQYISYYYGELNMIHPFREGNGRTLRVYMEFLVDYLDFNDLEIRYSLWSDDDREELLKSTVVSSVTGDTSGIMGCFDKVLVEKEKKKLRQ